MVGPRTLATCLVIAIALADLAAKPRQIENLGRGVVAVRFEHHKVFVGWRLLGTDVESIAFNVYRETNGGRHVRLNAKPIVEATSFVDTQVNPAKDNSYFVRPVVSGREQKESARFKLLAHG